MLRTIADLSAFLHEWYGLPEGELGLSNVTSEYDVAPPLAEVWTRLGRLTLGDTIGPAPMACQDELAGPGAARRLEDRVEIVFENQGNWSAWYRDNDPSPDPQVWSDWSYTERDLEEGTSSDAPIGASLSEFLITVVLQETVFFGWDERDVDAEKALSALCTERVWKGHFLNVAGIDQFAVPSHGFRMNADKTLMAMDMSGGFSGFCASRATSRERLSEFFARFESDK